MFGENVTIAFQNKMKKKMRQAKKDWIEDQCKDMEESIHRKQTRRAY